MCSEEIFPSHILQILQLSVVFNIRISCMDNNFPVKHLSIHNITQENFYMASGGLYHDIFFVFFKSGTPFYGMDCLCHNLFQFFIGKWLHQIMKCSDIKCLKNILLCCCHKNEYHILIVLPKHLCRFHSIHSRHLNIQK